MLNLLLNWFTVAATVLDCNTSSMFRPTTLGLTPASPIAGDPVHMTVQFENTGSAVTEGIASTSVTLNYVPFAPSEEPLCENTACPLVSGFNDRSIQFVWPSDVQGKVVATTVWSTLEGETLLCLQTSVTVGLAPHLRSTDADASSVALLFRDDISLKQVALRRYPTCPVAPDTTYYWLAGSYVNSSA